MSLPLLHSFAGYTVYRLSKQEEESNWKVALSCIFLANAADLDFIPGIVIGRANEFHHCASHSLGAAVLCGLFIALIAKFWKKRNFLKTFLMTTAAYASHILLDYFNDAHEGMPVFWPLTNFSFPAKLTMFAPAIWDPVENGGLVSFIRYVISVNSLRRLVSEVVIIGLLLLLSSVYGEWKKRLRLKEPVLLFEEE